MQTKFKGTISWSRYSNSAYVFLENIPTVENPNAISISLSPKSSTRKECNNNNIIIEVEGNLDKQLNVHAFKGSITYVVGFSINGGQKNNTADLKQVEISNSETLIDPITGQVRIIQRDKKSAFQVSEYVNNLNYSNINIDFGPKLFDQILLLVHSRWSMQEERKPQWNPAIGLYFTKTGAPTEIVAGIQVQTLDWNNNSEVEKSRGERTLVNIVAGYSF